jgi:very-short-patch-repair endonuclease
MADSLGGDLRTQLDKTGVVFRQRVSDGKVGFARRLRREMTRAEGLMWEQLRDRRLVGLKFRRQQIVDGFIADFYCDSARLVVEIDGG